MSQHELQSKLEEEHKGLEVELNSIAVLSPDTGDWVAVPPPVDPSNADTDITADTTEEWNERRAILAQLEIRYRNVNRALAKINDGSYGVCEVSGEPIEQERLQANPAARTNIANREKEDSLPL